jgi:hypothetical protein
MAHGNFFPSMQLQNGDSQEVCGPIVWAGNGLPALEVEIVVVVVTQVTGGALVIGMTQGLTTFPSGSGVEWEADVFNIDGGAHQFQAGPAHGHAVVRVTVQRQHGERQLIEFWNEPISFSL